MSFFAWNMCGFNQPRKHAVWLSDANLDFGCLLETRILETNYPAHEAALLHPNDSSFVAVTEATSNWHHFSYIEKQFYKQNSRIKWLKEGDLNTAYFHCGAQSRASNTIRRLTSAASTILTDLDDIKKEAVSYFSSFLQQNRTIDIPDLSNLGDYSCPLEAAVTLIASISSEVIQAVVFSLPSNKAPCPDGLPGEFFKICLECYCSCFGSKTFGCC